MRVWHLPATFRLYIIVYLINQQCIFVGKFVYVSESEINAVKIQKVK